MKHIWLILTTLTLARTVMGFQFQSVAAIGSLLTTDSKITHAELGALIGVYLLPGVIFAIPGGWLGKRFGDKQVVLTGLLMMTFGGLLFALSDTYQMMFIGRLISGLGAVLLNVLVTKMVADWFAEFRIEIAMGILISSWPLGIAVALMSMGPLEELLGLRYAFLVPAILCAIAFFLVFSIYSNSPDTSETTKGSFVPTKAKLTNYEIWGVFLSGCVWCLYNIAFILPLSFGPEYLVTKGIALTSAGSTVSLASWLIIPALPMGAWIAERIGRPDLTIIATFVAAASLILMIPISNFYIIIFAALGLVFGPAGGLIMALPSQVLSKENRAIGMGIFFTIYYSGMAILPVIAGYVQDFTGSPSAPFILAGISLLIAIVTLVSFRMIQVRQL